MVVKSYGKIGKYLFENHKHNDRNGTIMYSESTVLKLLEMLDQPQPDWEWFKNGNYE